VKHTELERRFLVRSIDPDIQRSPSRRMVQGYFDALAQHSLRIRVTDDSTATLTCKSGKGIARVEDERAVDLETARFLLAACPHVLEKTRYQRDGWDVDFFHGPLAGLVLAERELERADEPVGMPPWIHDAVEVTDSLTNGHLARLAGDLPDALPLRPVRDILPRRVPHVVLTGGPCSGKSTIMEILRKEMGAALQFVPEVATIVIAQVGVRPPVGDPLAMRGFQRAICRVQRCFEQASNSQAVLEGKRGLLLDRGVIDNAAYCPGGVDELMSVLHSTREHEYEQYDVVLCLDIPPREVYEANRRNNPARSESYEAACALNGKIREVWGGHPRFQVVENGRSWEEKVETVRAKLREVAGA